MNPNVDLTSFSRTGTPANAASVGVAGTTGTMVSPPGRFVTRYILPGLLLLGFVSLALYSMRGVWQKPITVRVQTPILTGTAGSLPAMAPGIADIATTANASAPVATTPLFQAPGWIEPSPLPITITALTPGNVKAVHVLEGQPVTSGTLVAELVSEEHELEVRSAEANLLLKKAQLEAAQADWDNPIALREAIRTAQAEAVRLQAEKAKAMTMSELATKEAEAGRSLTRGGYEAGLSVFRQQAEERTGKNSIQEIEAKLTLNQVTLQASEERLKLRIEDKQRLATAKAEVQNAEVQLAQAKLRHDRCWIHSPVDGVIMQLFVRPGSMISPDVEGGMQLAALYDPASLQVRTEVPLADTSKVQVGLAAEIRVDAVPDRVYHGELVRIVPQADVQKNVLPVKVKITDPDGQIRPDMIAKVQFLKTAPKGKDSHGNMERPGTNVNEAGMLLPENLVNAVNGDTAEVWIATANGTAATRKVKLGPKSGNAWVITSGLQPPDRVISTNFEKLKPGIRVRIEEGN